MESEARCCFWVCHLDDATSGWVRMGRRQAWQVRVVSALEVDLRDAMVGRGCYEKVRGIDEGSGRVQRYMGFVKASPES